MALVLQVSPPPTSILQFSAPTSFIALKSTPQTASHKASFLLIFPLSSVRKPLIFFLIFGNIFFFISKNIKNKYFKKY